MNPTTCVFELPGPLTHADRQGGGKPRRVHSPLAGKENLERAQAAGGGQEEERGGGDAAHPTPPKGRRRRLRKAAVGGLQLPSGPAVAPNTASYWHWGWKGRHKQPHPQKSTPNHTTNNKLNSTNITPIPKKRKSQKKSGPETSTRPRQTPCQFGR